MTNTMLIVSEDDEDSLMEVMSEGRLEFRVLPLFCAMFSGKIDGSSG